MRTVIYFDGLKALHYRTGVEMWEYRYNKCIFLNGGYVED